MAIHSLVDRFLFEKVNVRMTEEGRLFHFDYFTLSIAFYSRYRQDWFDLALQLRLSL